MCGFFHGPRENKENYTHYMIILMYFMRRKKNRAGGQKVPPGAGGRGRDRRVGIAHKKTD